MKTGEGGRRVDSDEPADARPAGGPGAYAAYLGPLGIVLGCAAYWALARAVAVPVEVWEGVNTFAEPRWFAGVALVPAVAGFVTGIVAGEHGKWYGMVPVAILHPVDYVRLATGADPEVHVLGFGLFVFFMLVMLELGLVGGWGADILRHRIRRRDVGA